MNPLTLWLLGLVLIFLEFYLPGAVMGTAGGLLILASIFLFVTLYPSPLWIALFFIAVAISIGAVIKFAIWYIPRTKSNKSIYSDDAQVGFQASSFDKSLVGKRGVVISDLKPGGYILVDGAQQQALSESGYVVAGEEVLVLRGEGDSLIVKKVSQDGKHGD